MKKKFLILLFISFFLCGCKADYNLIIDDNKISEEIKLYSDNRDEYENTIYRGFNLEENFKAFSKFKQSAFVNTTGTDFGSPEDKDSNDMGHPIYQTEYLSGNNLSGTRLKYTFNHSNYKNSYAVNVNSRGFNFSSENGNVSLEISNTYVFTSYKLLDILNININVSDDYEVISHNAESVNGNNYIWTVTRDNYIDKKLVLKLEYKNSDSDNNTPQVDEPDNSIMSDIDNNVDESGSPILIIIGIVLGVVLFGGLIILIIKKNQIDKL